MKILSVGWFLNESSTSLHRHLAIKKFSEQIDAVECGAASTSLFFKVAYHLFQKGVPIRLPDKNDANELIKKLVSQKYYDLVWIDKGITINRKTLSYIKTRLPKAKIVSFSPDNMVERHNQSLNYLECIPLYDIHFTTKSYIVESLRGLGAKNVHFVHKTYSEEFHYPRNLSSDEKRRLGADVGFIGAWEKERCNSILYLVDNGIRVKVYGGGNWNNYKNYASNLEILPGVFSEDYPKALSAFKISLCFLRKMNKDQQTARTMEIPACKSLMLAERTQEHQALFEEGKEAEFFSSDQELLNKCEYYLKYPEQREKIAAAGLQRCKDSGYSNERTIEKMLSICLSEK